MTQRKAVETAKGAKKARRPRKSATRRTPDDTGRRGKQAPESSALAESKSNTLVNKLKPGETLDEVIADGVVAGVVSNAITAVRFSKSAFGEVDLTQCLAKLDAAVGRVQTGDLREAESLLTVQAVTLNTMFTHLANMAVQTQSVDHLDRYTRLALKAQGQCRATLETLATIKRPPAVFAQQANITQGPQQVNNTVALARRDVQPTPGETENPHESDY